ncbi:MAG: hypothetical protein AAB421_03950 [Patescibacteria group bacterium]
MVEFRNIMDSPPQAPVRSTVESEDQRLEAYIRKYIATPDGARFNDVDYFFTQSRLKSIKSKHDDEWIDRVAHAVQSMILVEVQEVGKNAPGVSYEWLAGLSAAAFIDVTLMWINYLIYPTLGVSRWAKGNFKVEGNDLKAKLWSLKSELLKLSPTIETSKSTVRISQLLMLYIEALERK